MFLITMHPAFRRFVDKAAEILASLCMQASSSPDRPLPAAESSSLETSNWVLKANVTVFRHADRTPKQKLKFNFPIGESWTQPFVLLLNGERDEIILREKVQLELIAKAVEDAKALGADGEDLGKLTQLNNALFSKIDLPGTKAQLKPVYSKKQAGQVRSLIKLTLVFKWGGEVCLSGILPKLIIFNMMGFYVVYTFGKVSVKRPWRKHEEGHYHHECVRAINSRHTGMLTIPSQTRNV